MDKKLNGFNINKDYIMNWLGLGKELKRPETFAICNKEMNFTNKCKPCEEVKLKEAVEVLCNALREDPSYYISWQANIAMTFYDEYCRYFEAVESVYDKSEVHLIANEAAKNFLNLLINK